jgi:hypothetical protein
MLQGIKSWLWTSAESLKGEQIRTSKMSTPLFCVIMYYKPISLSLSLLSPPCSEESPFRTMDTTKVSTSMHDCVGVHVWSDQGLCGSVSPWSDSLHDIVCFVGHV